MAFPGKGNAAPRIAKRVADWLDSLGSLKCDNEPAILALAQEIRRLRRESSMTIFEHPKEAEKQSNDLLNALAGLETIVKFEHSTLILSTLNLKLEALDVKHYCR